VKLCIIIPVYNHADTAAEVIAEAAKCFPVIVVDDGSTDGVRFPAGIELVRFSENRGKGAALRAGFERARERGFTHAITMDADGQHSPNDLPKLAEACAQSPGALVIGVRDLVRAGAPKGRRRSNAVSNFWFHVETGVRLSDTQCGFRAYPLAEIASIQTHSERYAFELELLVRSAWCGIPIAPVPVNVKYSAATMAHSHFRPVVDLAHITAMNIGLVLQSWFVPLPLRVRWSRQHGRGKSFAQRFFNAFREFFTDQAHSPRDMALAVGLGLFCGIAPIWGYQMVAAAALAHFLRLNKAIALLASNISIPPVMPFILYGGLALGHWIFTGRDLEFSAHEMTRSVAFHYLGEWCAGSLILGLVVALSGTVITYGIARWFRSSCHRAAERLPADRSRMDGSSAAQVASADARSQ
jgi:glycosyltransferase involved in cell wall biosynthesis